MDVGWMGVGYAPHGAVRAHVSRSGRSLALGICPWRALHACVGSYGPRGPAEACVISARSRSEVMTLDRDRAEVNFSNTGETLGYSRIGSDTRRQVGWARPPFSCVDQFHESSAVGRPRATNVGIGWFECLIAAPISVASRFEASLMGTGRRAWHTTWRAASTAAVGTCP